MSSRNLATAGTSAVGSSVASDSTHIGGNREHSMTRDALGLARIADRLLPSPRLG